MGWMPGTGAEAPSLCFPGHSKHCLQSLCASLSSALVVILCKIHPISIKLLSIDFASEEFQKRQHSKNKWYHDSIRAQAKSPGFTVLCHYF